MEPVIEDFCQTKMMECKYYCMEMDKIKCSIYLYFHAQGYMTKINGNTFMG